LFSTDFNFNKEQHNRSAYSCREVPAVCNGTVFAVEQTVHAPGESKTTVALNTTIDLLPECENEEEAS
jgi:hypothetical protein